MYLKKASQSEEIILLAPLCCLCQHSYISRAVRGNKSVSLFDGEDVDCGGESTVNIHTTQNWAADIMLKS